MRSLLPCVLPAVIAAVALSSCSDPYTNTSPEASTSRTSSAAANRLAGPDSGELPGAVPGRDRARLSAPRRPVAPSADAAIRAFAIAATNWTASTVPEQQRDLAARAVGQARQDAEQLAATSARDPQLTHSGTRNRGTVAGLVPRPGEWTLVVVGERLDIGSGVPPERRYRIYRAHTTATPEGAAVDKWQPEP